mmetsp:Transcript_57134/g.167760  ORF Transcript_57134/g.167760 Transcript_57134/m.167760 type:complete len:525 (+) Transcript_57134:891-2465(+)
MCVPASGAKTPIGFEGSVWISIPLGPTEAESARPGELLTSDSPRPTTTSTSASSLFALASGERVWMTKAYWAKARGCTSTASMSASSGTPIWRRLETARSVHLEAQTPFSARCQGAESSIGAPPFLSSARMAASRSSGIWSSSTTCWRAAASWPSSTRSSSFSRKSSFMGSARTFSNMPKGTVALTGTLYSPAFGVSSERWKLLPPRLLRFLAKSLIGRMFVGGGGGFTTLSCCFGAAALSTAGISFSAAFVQVTSPLGATASFRHCPLRPCSCCRMASSSQLARRTFWLRARIATCERTSTACAAGRRSATMPAGMSSQPVSVSVTAMHGALPAGSSAGSAFITMTVPMIGGTPPLTSSHGPMPAPRRSCGCRDLRTCATRRSERQRAVSSPKVASTFASGLKTEPGLSPAALSWSQHFCRSSATTSATPEQTHEMRSQAASMYLHHSGVQRWKLPWSPSDMRWRSSKPCSSEGSFREMRRSRRRVTRRPQSSSLPMAPKLLRSATMRSWVSSATSSMMTSRL